MEPAAPGTEDEVKPFRQYNKQENEKERLLSIKARLSNGRYGNVFEFSYQNGCEAWYCNLCNCPVMGKVYHHEIGKRHTNNMQSAGLQLPSTTETEFLPNYETTSVQVAPGEPMPPGFEGEAVTQIQEKLDNYKVGPLIGLEYLLEIHEYDREKNPSYLCILCDKRGDPRTVIAHLASYNHLSQYLQRHYITTYRTLSPYMTKQFKPNWQAAMQKIAEAIESKYGRLKPHYVERDTFEQKRDEYQQMIARGPHFSDKNGVTFEELLDKEELTKPVNEEQIKVMKPSEDLSKRLYRKSGSIPSKMEKRSPSPPVVNRPKKPVKSTSNEKSKDRRASLSSVSSISSSDLSDFESFPKKVEKRDTKPKRAFYRSRSRSHSPNRRLRYKRKSSTPPREKRLVSDYKLPWKRPDYTRPRPESIESREKNRQEKLEQYKKLAAAIENDMEKVKKQHEKNPEKHPQYNEEWKKFWNKRYKELQLEGKDAVNYDFKPEWIQFWNKKMLEFHNIEVKSKKDALRKRLGLPEEPAPVCFRITGKKKTGTSDSTATVKSTKPLPLASAPDIDPDVIVIDDKDDSPVRKRSHSPWETESGRSTAIRERGGRSDKIRDRSRSMERGKSRDKFRDRSRSTEREKSRDRNRSRSRERSRNKSVEYDRKGSKGREKSSVEKEKSWARGRERDHLSWDSRFSPSRDKRYMVERSYDRDGFYRDSYKKSYLPGYLKPPRVMRDVTRHPVLSPPLVNERPPPTEPEIEDGEVNIVSVLRLLTALEEKLGSLGPKVIDLLAKALAMEKNEANSSDTLLDNEVNCVLFETVKEKLKGQLLAGLVDYNQEKTFKNVIKKTAELIHVAEERRRAAMKNKPKLEPVTVPGIGTIDKAAIAKQIATALVMQGKTDVTQQELEQLINAVVGMAEASKNSNKPMNTASFLQQLTAQKPAEQPPPSTSLFSEGKSTTKESPLKDVSVTGSNMDGLSDSDLQTLLQNFKDLSTEEQHGLINYLKKLEAKEPERVERLRKFVKLDSNDGESTENDKSQNKEGNMSGLRGSSPFSKRLDGGNPMLEEDDYDEKNDEIDKDKEKGDEAKKDDSKINIDSEDEDYSYEDVFKAASKNISEKQKLDEKKEEEKNLTDAKALIANLMGKLGARNSAPRDVVVPASSNPTPTTNVPISSNLTDALSNLPISITNLASIVNNATQNSKNNQALSKNPTPSVNTPINVMSPAMINNLNFQPRNQPQTGYNNYGNNPVNNPGNYVSRNRSDMDGNTINPPGGPVPHNNSYNYPMQGYNQRFNRPESYMAPKGPDFGHGDVNMRPGVRFPQQDYGKVQYPIKTNPFGNQFQRTDNYQGPQGAAGNTTAYPDYEQNRNNSGGRYSAPAQNRGQYERQTNYGGRW